MRTYNPNAIRDLAVTFNIAATVMIVVAVIAGMVMAGVGLLGGSFGGDGARVVSVISGLLAGGIVFFIGYLISLVLKGAAHLMLAIVEIEANTAASCSSSNEFHRSEKVQPSENLGGGPPPKAPVLPVTSDAELMAKYGITYDGEKYHYRSYRYDELSAAVNYAKAQAET